MQAIEHVSFKSNIFSIFFFLLWHCYFKPYCQPFWISVLIERQRYWNMNQKQNIQREIISINGITNTFSGCLLIILSSLSSFQSIHLIHLTWCTPTMMQSDVRWITIIGAINTMYYSAAGISRKYFHRKLRIVIVAPFFFREMQDVRRKDAKTWHIRQGLSASCSECYGK